MIGKNWMKAFAFAGALAVVAGAMPAISEARTHYTGKIPEVVRWMPETPVVAPVKSTTKKSAVKHSTKKKHHKKLSSTAKKSRKSPLKKK